MKVAGIAAAVALVGMLVSSGAQATSGDALLKNCQAAVRMMDSERLPSNDSLGVGQCFGLMEGVKSMLVFYEESIPSNQRACIPNGGINNGQAARIASKYLHDNPAKLNMDATLLTILAFRDAYPCK